MAGIVHELQDSGLLEQIRQEAATAARQLAEAARLHKGQIVVIGCSTSEVVGHQVGSWSTPEAANAIFRGLDSVFTPMGVYMAAQCCEHLNRALIVEREAVPGAEIVNVGATAQGGQLLCDRRLSGVSGIRRHWRKFVRMPDMDIGGTLIGMHLKKVAVPVRLAQNHIGQAMVLAARTRPKFIGGDRAVYDEELKNGYPCED